MGIRYYAYAFDADVTEHALVDPRSAIGLDPLADAWGFEPGPAMGVTDFRQVIPERDLLYLDKAWRELQLITSPRRPGTEAAAAYRMFEGEVRFDSDGGWDPWVRVVPPNEVAAIARDLGRVDMHDVEAALAVDAIEGSSASETDYVLQYLRRAQDFTRAVASDGRGFAYLIG